MTTADQGNHLWLYALHERAAPANPTPSDILPFTDEDITNFLTFYRLRFVPNFSTLMALFEKYVSGGVVSLPKMDKPFSASSYLVPPEAFTYNTVNTAQSLQGDPAKWKKIVDLFNIAFKALPVQDPLVLALNSNVTDPRQLYANYVLTSAIRFSKTPKSAVVATTTSQLGGFLGVATTPNSTGEFLVDVQWDTHSDVVVDGKLGSVPVSTALIQAALNNAPGSLVINFQETAFTNNELTSFVSTITTEKLVFDISSSEVMYEAVPTPFLMCAFRVKPHDATTQALLEGASGAAPSTLVLNLPTTTVITFSIVLDAKNMILH